jgi:hypothetical protein
MAAQQPWGKLQSRHDGPRMSIYDAAQRAAARIKTCDKVGVRAAALREVVVFAMDIAREPILRSPDYDYRDVIAEFSCHLMHAIVHYPSLYAEADKLGLLNGYMDPRRTWKSFNQFME